MQIHPVADLFPMMSDEEFKDLVEDIRARGLLEPIWTFEDQIIDGRHRFRACRELQIMPQFREWNGEGGDLVSFVISLNLNRRHLSPSQKAMIAARRSTIDGKGRPKKNTHHGIKISQSQTAQILGISKRNVSNASKVLKDGIPELAEKVDSGEMPVSTAAQIASLPPARQRRTIRAGRKASRRLMEKLRDAAVRNTVESGSGCLACDPEIKFTDKTVSAHMQMLANLAPDYARYFDDIIEELAAEKLSETTRDNYDKILTAIDRGFVERSDLQRASGLSRDEFAHTVALMLDYGMIEQIGQGGKSAVARGAVKTLFQRKAHPEPKYELFDGESDPAVA